jgi:hypothetical protein
MTEHEPTVQVCSHGCRVECSCGWATWPELRASYRTKRDVMAMWYDHYVYQRRLASA